MLTRAGYALRAWGRRAEDRAPLGGFPPWRETAHLPRARLVKGPAPLILRGLGVKKRTDFARPTEAPAVGERML